MESACEHTQTGPDWSFRKEQHNRKVSGLGPGTEKSRGHNGGKAGSMGALKWRDGNMPLAVFPRYVGFTTLAHTPLSYFRETIQGNPDPSLMGMLLLKPWVNVQET